MDAPAVAVGEDISTEADDVPGLHARVRDAAHCHSDDGATPGVIRWHFTREEVIAA
ncbi:MAG: 2-oxoisovalerate dehydrogenase [Rhodocyclales bacterium CG_4_9_14_3_um_filter_68_10]|nr:MAG: 2-oxoisovalerate dehydrogenase [Rhodocyclales bacterium CG_4_10_14_3_um_filter_68_10]PJA58381.1 MAG: 2-oxoisovalerate dehydrogenase [Rhodocyclales bacterium CG_4_9_14_3_um_filter_68_10]